MSDHSTLLYALCLMAGLSWPAFAHAQSAAPGEPAAQARWTGQWSAEGLPFVVQVKAGAGRMEISPVEPSTRSWVASNGRINDDTATVEIEYQGVTATALIQLITDDTAIARTLSCQPDYHMVCTLARNQQARFNRLPAATASAGE